MSSVSAISAVSSAYQPTLLALQSELMVYSQFATGRGPAAVDYQAFQYALESHDISGAQTALARLQRDSEGANPASFAIPTAAQAAESNAIPVVSADGQTTPSGSLIDFKA